MGSAERVPRHVTVHVREQPDRCAADVPRPARSERRHRSHELDPALPRAERPRQDGRTLSLPARGSRPGRARDAARPLGALGRVARQVRQEPAAGARETIAGACDPRRWRRTVNLKRLFVVVLAGALFVEALSTAVWFAGRMQTVFAYDWLTIALTFARAGVAVVQFSAANQLAGRRPAARPLGRAALFLGAVVLTLEIGFGWGSTTILPSHRWWVVTAYWIYATAASFLLRSF